MTTLSPDPILRRLHACIESGVPAFLWGGPGTGKTARVKAYADARGVAMQRWLLSRCEPIDLKPRVYHEGRAVVLEAPEMEALIAAAKTAKGKGIRALAFYDELNLATRETEGASLDKIDAPPEYVAVVAAGNPPNRGQAARNLGAPAANRFCHLTVEADTKTWAIAKREGWPSALSTPLDDLDAADLTTARARAAMLVSTYIERAASHAAAADGKVVGNLLDAMPTDPVKAGRAWPSPRTWEYVEKLTATSIALGLDMDDRLALIGGSVGEGVGVEFLNYVRDADLVDPEGWLAAPTAFCPDRIDRVIGGLTSVVAALQSNFTAKRWDAAWKIIKHVETQNYMDAAMAGGELLIAHYRSRPADKRDGATPAHKHMSPRMIQLIAP